MKSDSKHRNKPAWVWFIRIAHHSLGVGVILSILALLFVNSHVLEAMKHALVEGNAEFASLITVPILIEVGLAACLWALSFITYRYVTIRVRESKDVTRVALKRSRGTIMTETLIVLPIFLLLTSGLAQLAINSTANVLMALATFQAGRTAWLWEPETRPGNARNGMAGDRGGVEERARIAAATVLAPVAPAEFRGSCSYSTLMDDRMKAIGAGTFSPLAMGGAGAVQAVTTGQDSALGRESTFVRAFDTSTFAERAGKKFYIAYCLTQATYTVDDEEIRTQVNYDHINAFPWFAYVFGKKKFAAGQLAWFSEYGASYGIRPQIDVNPREALSLTATLQDAIDSLF